MPATGAGMTPEMRDVLKDHMRRIAATMLFVLAGILPALADEVPPRKAGLWEIKTDRGNGAGVSLVIHQCIDAATDHMMQSTAGAFAEGACSKRIVQRSGDTLTIDSACKIGGASATSHAVVTGSLDSAYTMTVTSQSEALRGGKLTM